MENMTRFNELMNDKDFVVSMLSQESAEDVQRLYAANGVTLTLEEVHEIGEKLNKLEQSGEELDENALDEVAGGAVITAATAWAVAKAAIAIGAAGLAIYKWYKSR